MSEAGIPSSVVIREELVRLVCGDLLGPAGGPLEEIVEPRVRERYLTGMLAPRRVGVAPLEQDELVVGGVDSLEEGRVNVGDACDAFLPRSLPRNPSKAIEKVKSLGLQ